jgi:hypothetical protein
MKPHKGRQHQPLFGIGDRRDEILPRNGATVIRQDTMDGNVQNQQSPKSKN